jgi:Tol biopolymer transport system component
VFATYLGGTGEDDAIMGARVDGAGNLYVAGHTKSADFPVTPGAAQSRPGGQSDCYLAKLAPDASRLLYATYLGGSENEFAEHRLWLYPEGDVLLAGWNGSADFPTTAGVLQPARRGPGDGFLTRLSADGTRFVFSTLLGGSGGENLLMPTPDAEGNIWVVGSTGSPDLPVTADALQSTFGGGKEDALLAAFSPDASRLVYCSYLGGSGEEMIRSLAFGPQGQVYLVGNTSSPDFPTTPGALRSRPADAAGDAFVMRLDRAG